MPARVVDLFEVVYVEQKKTERVAVALRTRDLTFELALEAPAVREAADAALYDS